MVSIGSLPASRSRMNLPSKIFSFQRAYMRCLISSVKLFASLGESLLPISSTKGAVVIGSDFLPVCGLSLFLHRAQNAKNLFFGEQNRAKGRRRFSRCLLSTQLGLFR